MSNRCKAVTAFWIFVATLSASLSCAPSPAVSPAVALRAVATEVAPPALAPASSQVENAEQAPAPAAEAPQTSKPRVLRRIKGSEMNAAVVKRARAIIDEHYKKPFGFEVEFEIDGKHFVGRIEQHYHPPGGEKHPWGPHAGCSLYVVEQA